MKQTEVKLNSAFTLVEILVATVVFSLFLTSLFSLYRLGTRMYLTGGWKLQKQKDAERFLNVLKERMEQGSSPVDVAADGTLTECEGRFTMVVPATYTYRAGMPNSIAIAGTNLLVAFPLCKPAIKIDDGLILYNMLRSRPNPVYPDLMILEFISTPSINAGPGQDFVTGFAFDFFSPVPDLMRFDANPQNFGIAPVQTSLEDILSVSFMIPPIPPGLVASDSLIRVDIAFEHPKYPGTTVAHSMTTSLEIPVTQGGL